MVSLSDSKKLFKYFNLDPDVIPLNQWRYGLNVELEHGERNELTNISNDDLVITGKIALAHLMEYPDYYARLKKMERAASKYWQNKNKNIFI